MDQKKSTNDPEIDALVKRIFALRPDSRPRVTAELAKIVAKGPREKSK
jgi:hypothetical protein